MVPEVASLTVLLISAFAGALVSSFAGFAFAPVAGVLLFTVLPPKVVLPILMICSIFVQVITLLYLRRSLSFGPIGMMLAGGALGVPLAIALFHRLDAHALQIGFGLFLAVYAGVMLMRPCARLRVANGRAQEAAVGFLGGLVGGLTAMPGAVPTLYCDCRGVSKETQRATVQPFILAMQIIALGLMAMHGDVNAGVANLVMLTIPALTLGVAAGLLLFNRVPDSRFRQIVLGLLLVTGLALAMRTDKQKLIVDQHDRLAASLESTLAR